MHETEVAGTPESFRQDMLQEQPQELCAGDCSGFDSLGFAVSITEGHLAAGAGDYVLLLNHAAIEIATEIEQHLLARADAIAIHDLLRGMALWQHEPRLGDGRQQLGQKHLGQRLVIEQIARLSLGLAFSGLGASQPIVWRQSPQRALPDAHGDDSPDDANACAARPPRRVFPAAVCHSG